MTFCSVDYFKFHKPFLVDSPNGLCLGNHYIPEELIVFILSHIKPSELLHLTLVCKKWCNIIKSDSFWIYFHNKSHQNKAKPLPWYVHYSYFTTNNFHNLLKNTTGERRFEHWNIRKNGGDHFTVESIPKGADPLPCDISDFNGRSGCFATSYRACLKEQEIRLDKKRLLRYIMKQYKPHIYVSEWWAGRFDCGSRYKLQVSGYGESHNEVKRSYNSGPLGKPPLFYKSKEERVEQWQGGAWKKVEIVVKDYPDHIMTLRFGHEGQDTQFWAGHYGSKMAGGVLKFLFDSIEPVNEAEEN